MNFTTTLAHTTEFYVLETHRQVVCLVVGEIPPSLVINITDSATEAERAMMKQVLLAFDLSRVRVAGGIT